jgi:hypothetical protein
MITLKTFKHLPAVSAYCICAEMPDGLNFFSGIKEKMIGNPPIPLRGVTWDTNIRELFPFPSETLAMEALEKIIDYKGAAVGIIIVPYAYNSIIIKP